MALVTTAITRKPGNNFAEGITAAGLGKPNFELALQQHLIYCETLKSFGVEVITLESDPGFPDGCFVEDAAVVTEQMAVITRPGSPLRRKEVETIATVLRPFRELEYIQSPGTLDGGDVLRVNDHFYIGLSQRTNLVGAQQLSNILKAYGYSSSLIQVKSVLHLKTGITYLGNNCFATIEEFYHQISGFTMMLVDQPEAYSANCLTLNHHLIFPKGFPNTQKQLASLGFSIQAVDVSEFQKMDGGLTCLSLLF